MLGYIKSYFREQRFKKEQLEKAVRWEAIAETRALLHQSNSNVRYLRASINTLQGVAKNVRGNNAKETNDRREYIRDKILWQVECLKEEEFMVEHYTRMLNELEKREPAG